MSKPFYSPGEIHLEHICLQCFRNRWQWKDCPNKINWYSVVAIVFCRFQMIFLILYLDLLSEGMWPPDPQGTGYIDNPIRRVKAEGHFVRPVQFAAEVNYRLSTTGEAGEALVDEIKAGILDYESLSRPAQRVLNYVSGWRRRKQSYSEFRATNKHRGGE